MINVPDELRYYSGGCSSFTILTLIEHVKRRRRLRRDGTREAISCVLWLASKRESARAYNRNVRCLCGLCSCPSTKGLPVRLAVVPRCRCSTADGCICRAVTQQRESREV